MTEQSPAVDETTQPLASTTNATETEHLLDKLRIMFEEADANNDKVLDFEEFRNLMNEWMPESNGQQLRTLFDAFDVDKSGAIKYTELLESNFFTQFLLQTNVNTNNNGAGNPQPNLNTTEHINGQDQIINGNMQPSLDPEYTNLRSHDTVHRKVETHYYVSTLPSFEFSGNFLVSATTKKRYWWK
ncbi:hypothetical protein RFI_16380 [Reticulomyxa filosa]|uniref:EF-hand domain-containing protein n=1 Tax=Reticulomyxa filosa TaxID=46433 RepID=X6N490_RETFI|nr:hypothetical protein RFI_16380 [Reticulomyxa filosa]|eukprot:ETO20831.1 hypothetical protein RFI_16380 [Reticulomyxa filosa]